MEYIVFLPTGVCGLRDILYFYQLEYVAYGIYCIFTDWSMWPKGYVVFLPTGVCGLRNILYFYQLEYVT